MATFGGGLRLLPQKVFDAMVVEVKDSTPGATLLEAVEEAKAVFEEEYALDGLFLYVDEAGLQVKQKLEQNVSTVEKCALGQETRVNCRFSFQGLSQTLGAPAAAAVQRSSWRLVEARKLVHSLVKLLAVGEGEGEDAAEKGKDNGEDDDDDDEDEEEDRILFFVAVLDLILFLANGAPTHFFSPETAFQLPPELVELIISRLDESMSEARLCEKIIDLLTVLLSQPVNKAAFAERGVAVLTLSKKFNAKNAALSAKVDNIVAHF